MYTLLLIVSVTYASPLATAVVPNLTYQECSQQINNIKTANRVVVESAQCILQAP